LSGPYCDSVMEIRRVPYDHPDAVMLMERVQAIYAERYGGPDESPMDAGEFTPPAGDFFVGYLEGIAVATGAWRHVGLASLGSTATAELKRMYVVEEAQRRGFARQMLAHLEAAAQAAGHDVLVLNTGDRQPEAITLYRSSGYERLTTGWGTYACHPGALFFAKRL
jgi:GNAT superfamily N-acetyltransferase